MEQLLCFAEFCGRFEGPSLHAVLQNRAAALARCFQLLPLLGSVAVVAYNVYVSGFNLTPPRYRLSKAECQQFERDVVEKMASAKATNAGGNEGS